MEFLGRHFSQGDSEAHERMAGLLDTLHSHDDMEVYQAVCQLSMELAMASDETLGSFPVDSLVPAIVGCLEKDAIPDTAMYALVSLNHLLENVRNASSLVVSSSGVPVLIAKLYSFEYIDTAEHAIKALERISMEHSSELLKSNCLGAMISMIDFFEVHVQMRILNTLNSIVEGLGSNESFMEYVVPAISDLVRLLHFKGADGTELNERACEVFNSLLTSIVRLGSGDKSIVENHFDFLMSEGLVKNLLELVAQNPKVIGIAFKCLQMLCKHSAAGLALLSNPSFITLLCDCLKVQPTEQAKEAYETVQEALQLLQSLLSEESDSLNSEVYRQNPELLRALGNAVLPQILSVHERIINSSIKQQALDILKRLVESCEADQVAEHITPVFATYLSELLSSNLSSIIQSSLQIIKSLYDKIPDKVAMLFLREGVLSKLELLISPDRVNELNFNVKGQAPRDQLLAFKNLIARSGTADPSSLEAMFQKIASRTRHNRAGSEELTAEHDLLYAHLRRKFSEPVGAEDKLETRKNGIIETARSCLRVHRDHCSQQTSLALQQLLVLCENLQANTGYSAERFWKKLQELITSELSLTYHEILVSKLPQTLWSWLTCENSDKEQDLGRRVHEFIEIMSGSAADGQSYLEHLVKALVGTVRSSQNFSIVLYEFSNSSPAAALKALLQRVSLNLIFEPTDLSEFTVDRSLLELKSGMLAEAGGISFSVDNYQSLDVIKEMIRKLQTPEQCNMMRVCFERTASEMRGINAGQINLARQQSRIQQLLLNEPEVRLEPEGKRLPTQLSEEQEEEEEAEESMFNHESMAFEGPELSNEVDIEFLLKGSVLPASTSIFELANKTSQEDGCTVTFRFVKRSVAHKEAPIYTGTAYMEALIKAASFNSHESTAAASPVIKLLKLIYLFNANFENLTSHIRSQMSSVSAQSFTSQKLSALLAKQTEDAVSTFSGVAPHWTRQFALEAPFLFSFPLRTEVFKATGFSCSRVLQHYAQKLRSGVSISLLKQKVRVQRSEVLEAAINILSEASVMKFGQLEFEFIDEDGTGTGPTLEFYSLVSQALRKLKIWRNSGKHTGLFPAPNTQDHKMFHFIGVLVGKALTDGRLLDLPLSPVFWKLVFNEPICISDVYKIDRTLGKTLLEFHELVSRKQSIISQNGLSSDQRSRYLNSIHYKGSNIDSLGLNFTLPGYSYELKENGQTIPVTLENLDEYVQLVTKMTLAQSGPAAAFKEGLSKLIKVERLKMFTGEELEYLICGAGSESWTHETLAKNVVPAHGFSKQSSTFKNLLAVMETLTSSERRLFLQFATGSPRLPVGGFEALNPPLTVVKKGVPAGCEMDSYLPSVMTCQNYLKLPDYTCREALEKNLKYAISEAHETFHLS